jgi:hypothetical protein
VTPEVYKFLNGREATHVPGYRYRFGVWREVSGPLVPCVNGLHLLRPEHLSRWCARDLFVAEYAYPPDAGENWIEQPDKIVVRKARIVEHLKGWNERTARLAATDFAEAVLPIFEARHPTDDRPRLAIQAARDYANGLIDDAAWAAAWAAAEAAARAAARDAARDAAWAAAEAAAEVAAEVAAWAAARAAAWAAARASQGAIILDYAYGRRA